MSRKEPKTKNHSSLLNLRLIQLNSKVLSTFFLDLLFYISIIALFFLFATILKSALSNLQQLDYSNILTADLEAATANLVILKSVFTKMIIIILLFIISSIISFTLFKGLIWTRILEAKFRLKYFLKTLLMNLIYFTIFLLLIIYSMIKLDNSYLTIILILLFFHFNALSYCFITKKHQCKIFRSIKESFRFSLYIVNYILPYILISVLFLALMIITQLILTRIISQTYYPLLMPVFLVLYLSIIRNYFAKLVEKIENE